MQYVHVTLHKALEQAQGDGLVARNAAKGIKGPRHKKKEIAPLTPDQARAFLEAALIEVGAVRRRADPLPLPRDGRDLPRRRCE